jgi:pyridoxine 5-phosphate synthase
MIRLSVNLNKVATVRNARGGHLPSVVEAARVAVGAGSHGITVHPRADARHITTVDVHDVARLLAPVRPGVEFNVEGDPRPDFVSLVKEVRPDQCTVVPVMPGEITSQAGWPPDTDPVAMRRVVGRLQAKGIRVSLFVDPDPEAVRWAGDIGTDRIELYTEPFARAFERGQGDDSFGQYAAAAELAHALGLGVNAGHDLDLTNLPLFRDLPRLDEVSIGHALISHALWVGLDRAVRDYLAALAGPAGRRPAGPVRAV